MKEKQNVKKAKLKEVDIYKQKLQMYEQMPEQIKELNGLSDEQFNVEVAELKHLIELSNRGKSNRRKGANFENAIAKRFKEKWGITLVRTPLSGGFQKSSKKEEFKGDLNCIDPGTKFLLHPECKKHQRWSVGKWWNQTEDDCPEGKYPLLVMHRFQKVDGGKRTVTAEDFVMMKLDDFLEVVDKKKVIIEKGGSKNEIKRGKIGKRTSVRGSKN